MNRFIQLAIAFLFVTAVLMFGCILPSFAADLQVFSNAKLINNPANDGDSFLVEANGKSLHICLYFVDCPESSANSDADAQRVREQTRYFGLSDVSRTIHFGKEAKAFTEHALAQPFTIYTAFANTLGRSSVGRVYGFITTCDGKDLASLLVKNGFARAYETGRQTPDGLSRDEMSARFRDFEVSAILKRVGIWSQSDPDRIAELRAKQRNEEQELDELKEQIKESLSPKSPLDLNTANKKELMSVKGIGPVLAERIIAARPYKTVDALLKVRGIGPKNLEKFRPYFIIGK